MRHCCLDASTCIVYKALNVKRRKNRNMAADGLRDTWVLQIIMCFSIKLLVACVSKWGNMLISVSESTRWHPQVSCFVYNPKILVIRIDITEEERNRKMFTFKKLKQEMWWGWASVRKWALDIPGSDWTDLRWRVHTPAQWWNSCQDSKSGLRSDHDVLYLSNDQKEQVDHKDFDGSL